MSSGSLGIVEGWSVQKLISAATTNATLVKNGPGRVGGWAVSNVNAAPCYVKFYNKASAPTVGTDVPVMTVLIPGNASGILSNVEYSKGIKFDTGIAFAITTGAADADTGAVAANEVIVNVSYV